MKKVRAEQRAKRVEFLLAELLECLDELLAPKGAVRKAYVKAAASFYRTQYEALNKPQKGHP